LSTAIFPLRDKSKNSREEIYIILSNQLNLDANCGIFNIEYNERTVRQMREIRVLLADFDEEHLLAMAHQLRQAQDITIAGSTAYADQVIPMLQKTGAHVLVTDLQLRGGDGLTLLQQLRRAPGLRVRTLVCSHFAQPALVARCAQLGAACYVEKPCTTAALLEHIRLAAEGLSVPVSEKQYLELRADQLLRRFGLLPNRKSFHYLHRAVCLWVQEGEAYIGITKWIYPAVASYYGVSEAAVERSIRQTIARLWAKQPTEIQRELFPPQAIGGRNYPTNGQFVSILARYLESIWRAEAQ
jgi:DNA-binding NarL/FixJ family response regulator